MVHRSDADDNYLVFYYYGNLFGDYFVYYRKNNKIYNENYMSEGIGLGICAGALLFRDLGVALGISLGMMIGLTIGMFIKKEKKR